MCIKIELVRVIYLGPDSAIYSCRRMNGNRIDYVDYTLVSVVKRCDLMCTRGVGNFVGYYNDGFVRDQRSASSPNYDQ